MKFIFSDAVLAWFHQHGRKNLPWQQKPMTPYRVYVSEIMLQQTQVATVTPYFQRFMQAFPTLQQLAAAPLDRVLHLWTGLGYYARARNLHKTANIVADQHQGEFPKTVAALQCLPGIGRSTAGAICALTWGQREPILDGNVKRVLARFQGVDQWPGLKEVEQQLWQLATRLLPQAQLREYTQAMMDIGASVCTRTRPRCEDCPLKINCIAYQKQEVTRYPGAKPKKAMPLKQVQLIMLVNQERVLLQKRPAQGIWGGLWSLPECDKAQREIPQWCRHTFGVRVKNMKIHPMFRHTFTHFHLEITPVQLQVVSNTSERVAESGLLWYSMVQPESIGLPQPICRILKKLELNA